MEESHKDKTTTQRKVKCYGKQLIVHARNERKQQFNVDEIIYNAHSVIWLTQKPLILYRRKLTILEAYMYAFSVSVTLS